jgi:intermembrane space import and assembly protein 40
MELSKSEDAITESGEINWDCPCLKEALEPPCGQFFKEAFNCFYKSTAEPKGSECTPLFEAMQRCFEENREHYIVKYGEISKENKTPE